MFGEKYKETFKAQLTICRKVLRFELLIAFGIKTNLLVIMCNVFAIFLYLKTYIYIYTKKKKKRYDQNNHF